MPKEKLDPSYYMPWGGIMPSQQEFLEELRNKAKPKWQRREEKHERKEKNTGEQNSLFEL